MKFLERLKKKILFRTPEGKKFVLSDDRKFSFEKAFTYKDVQYFCNKNVTDMAAGRGLSAMIHYEEFRMKCDHEYLSMHCKAVTKILNSPNIKLTELVLLHSNLEQRLGLALMPDHLLKLASIYFWDENESPYFYDAAYNAAKMDIWRKDPEVLSFFLQTPLRSLIGFLELPNENLRTYLRLAEQIDRSTRAALRTK